MSVRSYTLTEVRQFGWSRFDVHTVIDGRSGGFREFKSLDEARAAVAEGQAFDAKQGHVSSAVEYLLSDLEFPAAPTMGEEV